MTPPIAFGLLLAVLGSLACAANREGPWDAYNISPKTRLVSPKKIHQISGNVTNANGLLSGGNGSATIPPAGWVALDFGLEVGGYISLSFAGEERPDPDVKEPFFSSVTAPLNLSYPAIRLAFTESPLYVGPYLSDESTVGVPTMDYDGSLVVAAAPGKQWTLPAKYLRGGFRYLTISNSGALGTGDVQISNVTCSINFAPDAGDDLSAAYTGYFYAPGDPLLTKVWYAGAYTIQTNVVPVDTGRQIPIVKAPGWANNGSLGVAGPIIVDGAKRDRAVWPGDMGVAVPTAFVSTADMVPVKNALLTMFSYQAADGSLPESGPPLLQKNSDTYHAWTLHGTYVYHLYSGDDDFLRHVYANYTRGVAYLTRKVDPATGLLNVTGTRDWARLGGGGLNSEGNAIYYNLLASAAAVSAAMNDTALASAYSANATALKSAFESYFWDDASGMYVDNSTTTLHPQDANSLALWFGLTGDAGERAGRISKGLQQNWNEYGAVAPELPDTISPFIGSFELFGHFESGNDQRALDLLRTEWGYMVRMNDSVQSTLIEGYTGNGSIWYRSYRGYNYDPTYTSHAHGWSTGPTSALTFYVLGLRVASPGGRSWSFLPHPGDLTEAQGALTTPAGWMEAAWKIEGSGSGRAMTMTLEAPEGTTGSIGVPVYAFSSTASTATAAVRLLINGEARNATVVGGYAVVNQVSGGKVTVVARPQ